MFIETIPFDASIDDCGLTYYVSPDLVETLSVGSLVEVPIKNILSAAVVAKIVENYEDPDLKSISRVICPHPLMSPYEVDVIYALSSKYFVHIHKVLNLFFPKSLLTSFEKKDFKDVGNFETKMVQSEKKNEVIFNRFWSTVFPIIEAQISEQKDVVCVFPDDFSALAFSEYLNKKGIEITPMLHSDTPTKKYKNYISILEKRNPIIIWSRKILYYNLQAYSHILYIEDAFGKTTMNAFHTYRHMDVLSFIREYGHFSISIISSVPSLESMSLALRKQYQLINI